MREPNILYVVDEWRARGGAHRYLRDLIDAFSGCPQRIAVGRLDKQTPLPGSLKVQPCRALSSPVANTRGLNRLNEWIKWADVISIQNVHNPVALDHFSKSGKSIVTIQDHRFFCPSIGKTLPDRQRCLQPAQSSICAECIPDSAYLDATLGLMKDRRDAIANARCVVLSDYMAREWGALTGRRPMIAPPWTVRSGGSARREGWIIAGRLSSHKDPDFAFEAWNRAGRPETLYVLGDGKHSYSGVGVKALGWLDHDSFMLHLQKVRALLFPSLWQEPYGIVGMEALACNTPVIVCATGGMNAWMGRGSRAVRSIDEMAFEMKFLLEKHSGFQGYPMRSPSAWDHQRARSIGRWTALISTVASKR